MLRVVIVDDSPVARMLLTEVIDSDDDFQVVGVASDGAEGVGLVQTLRPDVVTMDVQMPLMDGYAATRHIMTTHPTPIVIVSGSMDRPDVDKSMQALEAGALTVIGKPGSPASESFDRSVRTLLDTLRSMAQVTVIRHRAGLGPATPAVAEKSREVRIVAIAASTGGPQALMAVLSELPPDFQCPILLVQHMSSGFTAGFADWLDQSLPLNVKLAEHRELLQPGRIYVGSESGHLGVGPCGRICISDGPPIDGFRPAATALFESVAEVYGDDVVAIVLSGMGRDGADGLKAVHQRGGFIVAQDEASCVVYGMPCAAAETGLTDAVQPPKGIAATLKQLVAR